MKRSRSNDRSAAAIAANPACAPSAIATSLTAGLVVTLVGPVIP